ncbi:hypothetical protein AB0D45_20240 [Streptomyces sp. NPDC048352]|uniref:hypothetical protein n=1 Tax=Streptomyces sp. NPDC048352 TaxID=3154718 RepID=UPI003430D828
MTTEARSRVTYACAGARIAVERDQVRRAAAAMAPAHSDTFSKNQAWFAVVGAGLYYVVDLLERATGHRPTGSDAARQARLALHELGFPVLCLAYGELLAKGHPAHRAEGPDGS